MNFHPKQLVVSEARVLNRLGVSKRPGPCNHHGPHQVSRLCPGITEQMDHAKRMTLDRSRLLKIIPTNQNRLLSLFSVPRKHDSIPAMRYREVRSNPYVAGR